MSRENAEVVRQVIEAVRPDFDEAAIESSLALWDPSCELNAGVEPQTYRGHDGIRRYVSDMADAWKEWRNEIDEILEAGPETVVATFRCRLVGKDSGVPFELRIAAVCVLSEGKLLRLDYYPSRAEALEAVGLRE